MLFWRHALKGNIIFLEGIFDILKALIVEDVQFYGMAVGKKDFIRIFARTVYAVSLAFGNGCRMDGICIVVIEYKNIVIAAAGHGWKFSGLIRIRFENWLCRDKHGANGVVARFGG